jgi:hypothetical protein
VYTTSTIHSLSDISILLSHQCSGLLGSRIDGAPKCRRFPKPDEVSVKSKFHTKGRNYAPEDRVVIFYLWFDHLAVLVDRLGDIECGQQGSNEQPRRRFDEKSSGTASVTTVRCVVPIGWNEAANLRPKPKTYDRGSLLRSASLSTGTMNRSGRKTCGSG